MRDFTIQDRINYLYSMGRVTDGMTQTEIDELAAQVSEAELGIAASVGGI